jgi:hypothetical protein
MSRRFTYGQLFERLEQLGYREKTIPWNGTRQHVFLHDTYKTAMIFLPEMPKEQLVEPMHLGTVRATLKAHGIIDDTLLGI